MGPCKMNSDAIFRTCVFVLLGKRDNNERNGSCLLIRSVYESLAYWHTSERIFVPSLVKRAFPGLLLLLNSSLMNQSSKQGVMVLIGCTAFSLRIARSMRRSHGVAVLQVFCFAQDSKSSTKGQYFLIFSRELSWRIRQTWHRLILEYKLNRE